MIGVAQAEAQLFAWADSIRAADEKDFPSSAAAASGVVELLAARTCFVAEGLLADRDFPPFDRVTMDGIALRFSALRDGVQRFRIAGVQAAGSPPLQLQSPGDCLEVMTGAVLPLGADTVIRYEDLERAEGIAHVLGECLPSVTLGQNIQLRAAECNAGTPLIAPGTVWRSPQWALAASVGKVRAHSSPRLRIFILATGDELVAPESVPLAHEIRASNPFALAAALREYGFEDVTMAVVGDDPAALVDVLAPRLGSMDVCILSGAVSAGKFDHVPATLRQLGVTEAFHGVRQRPGKPLWFGVSEAHTSGDTAAKNTLVFALPGNPVSALVCCYRYVIPTLRRRLGYSKVSVQAELAEPLRIVPSLTCFIPVIECEPGSALRTVRPLSSKIPHRAQSTKGTHTLGSGDLVALASSDGFVECPEGVGEYPKGSHLRYFAWERL